VTLIVLALAISGGGVAYALGTGILAPAPTASPTPVATPTETVTPTPPPTPTATPTPTPTSDAADPSTWTIGFDGIGPITLGMRMTDVTAAAPTFSDVTYDICRPNQLDLEAPDQLVISAFDTQDAPGVVGDLDVRSFTTTFDGLATPRTDRGIGIGSTAQDLFTAYPGIPKTGTYGDVTDYYGLNDGAGTWIVFQVIQGTVVRITVGPSSTMPSEYCPA